MTIRTGLGFDVHRLVEGRPCILGGVELPMSASSRPSGMSDTGMAWRSLISLRGRVSAIFSKSDAESAIKYSAKKH